MPIFMGLLRPKARKIQPNTSVHSFERIFIKAPLFLTIIENLFTLHIKLKDLVPTISFSLLTFTNYFSFILS